MNTEFEKIKVQSNPSLLTEVFQMLKHNKKYWMIPLILLFLFLALLIVAGGSAAAPFIYTLF